MASYKLLVHSASQVVQVVGDGSRVREGTSMKYVDVLEGSCSNGYSILVDRYVAFSFIFALFTIIFETLNLQHSTFEQSSILSRQWR